MRLAPPAAAVAALLAVAAPAAADQNDPRLDALFARLKTAPSFEATRPIEHRIWEIWGESDDEQSDFLMKQGQVLMQGQAFREAITDYSLLIAHAPDFAEAWNKRATLNYIIGDLNASLLDIEKTLELEPRHFGALSGMGLVLMRLDREADALKSFEAALAIHPYLPAAKAHVEMLRDKVLGEPL
ncbi:MAG: hypothetical protein KDG89_09375 [Geminicoccaceae bacterium]|nr:hypothetical protein [Geminicoccaceae bacterium]